MTKAVVSSLVLAVLAAGAVAHAAPINQVPYAALAGTQLITFDDIPGGPSPGTNYNGFVVSGGAFFAERFAGQINSPVGDFDALSGAPTGPLALVAGAPGQNLAVVLNAGTQVLAGLGPVGFPNSAALGEGAIAVLFTTDQSEFGLQLIGGNGGDATLDFFARDGSLIDQIVLTGLADSFYGFSREGGLKDIAGISIFNTDPGGIGVDNIKHDVESGQPVPEPSSLAMLGLGAALLAARRHRK